MLTIKELVVETIKSNPGNTIEKLCLWARIDEGDMVKHLYENVQEGKVVFEKRKGWKVK